jgi:hypothetical protein
MMQQQQPPPYSYPQEQQEQQQQQQQGLPPGWISQWDYTYQRPYYVNTYTRQSQWDPPSFAPPPFAQGPYYPPPAQPMPQQMPYQQPQTQPMMYQQPMINSTPQLPSYQSGPPSSTFLAGSSANNGLHTLAPEIQPVGVVDPTTAIALELKQSIPSLMAPPPEKSSQSVQDAWRLYVRRVQDAQ